MLSAVTGRHGALLKKAAAAASSWNDKASSQRVDELKKARSEALLAQGSENWAINAVVHYNESATMSQIRLHPGRQRLQTIHRPLLLLKPGLLVMDSCHRPAGGDEETLRCDCNTYNLNLRTK